MIRSDRLSRIAVVAISLLLLFTTAEAQRRSGGAAGNAVLWEPVDIARQDLYLGSGGTQMQPDLSRITFIEEQKGGYSKKYKIKDGSGRTWVAKIGKEAQSETAAVRLLSALGYQTEIVYLVPRINIPGKGIFTNVRLEARPDSVERGDVWRWSRNPFVGTDQLQGLKIMMAMFNNWDMKDANNVILETRGRQLYAISDLGATFGKAGISGFPLFRWIGRSRNAPRDYSKSSFISRVRNGRIHFNFRGKNYNQLHNITVSQGRWLAALLQQLSDRQIRDAFRAANYPQSDLNLLASAFNDRIEQLLRAVASDRMANTR
jgi:hypothetical protein